MSTRGQGERMALETVAFPQERLGYNYKELVASEPWINEFGEVREEDKALLQECMNSYDAAGDDREQWKGSFDEKEHENWDPTCSSILHGFEEWDANSVLLGPCQKEESFPENLAVGKEASAATPGRRKRRRARSSKNKEELESQRMTHIAVERNRRKLMNEHLSALRSLMPPSYVQRGDQASIVGGAINYVKELEQCLHSLEAQQRMKQRRAGTTTAPPFADFFTFPQYSSRGFQGSNDTNTANGLTSNDVSLADIEVIMVENHASLKVFSKRQPKQLLKLVAGLQSLGLTTFHLNMTTVDGMILYSFSLRVEDDSPLKTVDDVTSGVQRLLAGNEEHRGI